MDPMMMAARRFADGVCAFLRSKRSRTLRIVADREDHNSVIGVLRLIERAPDNHRPFFLYEEPFTAEEPYFAGLAAKIVADYGPLGGPPLRLPSEGGRVVAYEPAALVRSPEGASAVQHRPEIERMPHGMAQDVSSYRPDPTRLRTIFQGLGGTFPRAPAAPHTASSHPPDDRTEAPHLRHPHSAREPRVGRCPPVARARRPRTR